MYVHIRITRRRGRKIPDHEAYRPENQFLGCLYTNGSTFEVWQSGTKPWPPLARLYDARVLSIQTCEIYVRGYEEENGGGVLQEWVCKVLSSEEFFERTSPK
jgi:hypothetical protein